MTECGLTKSDFECMKAMVDESFAKNKIPGPESYVAHLPLNHSLWKLSDEEFKELAGPNVVRLCTGKREGK